MCARDVCATVCFSAHAAFAHKSQKISPSLNKKRKKKSDYFLQWWVAKLRDDDCLYPEMTLFPAAAANIISYLPLLNKRRTELVQQHIMIQQKYSISRIMKWKLSCKCRRAASGCFLHSCERERGREAQSEGCAALSMYGSAPRSKQPEWAELSVHPGPCWSAAIHHNIVQMFLLRLLFIAETPKKIKNKIGTKKIAPQIWT